MIALACSHCAASLKVKEELAGKRVRCPHCKKSVEVPAATLVEAGDHPRPSVADEATLPPPLARIDGARERAARPEGRTFAGGADLVQAGATYQVAEEIARGGMGTIMRAVDQDIRREVAFKFLLNQADARQKARFVEEAQITGQLEHPNIVPIHQLGVHGDGRCFFSMKMVKGRSLAEILKQQGEPGASATGGDYTPGRLLNILVSICNAMAYAHSRNVIHRDLKPANIMVGDFGEVYVMDWGLAKVLSGSSEFERSSEPERQRGPEITAETAASLALGLGSAQVTTARASVGDLTQAGSIMGTPAYMPPEQALGDNADERADIYSLGAILYEILTLTPPVGRGGDMMAIVLRVVEGKIEPPDQRAPQRAKAGGIPAELSAIALKALALKREDRYQTAEELKHDIELYLEGRSVSAKRDTAWEMFKKLVKRNKGVSSATAVSLLLLAVVLGVAFRINYAARIAAEEQKGKTDQAYAAYQAEQAEKERRTKEAVPAFLKAARQAVAEKSFDAALAQTRVVLDYDPDNADALLLRGQLLVSRKDFAAAATDLGRYLRLRPDDATSAKLAALCGSSDTDNPSVQEAMGHLLVTQKQLVLAVGLFQANAQRLATYRKQIQAGWGGKGTELAFDKNHRLKFNRNMAFGNHPTLTPLQGLPIASLSLSRMKIFDLTPLRGMPLTHLWLHHFPNLRDLGPLRDLPLELVELHSCSLVEDLSPLQAQRLTYLKLDGCPLVADLTPLKGMPLRQCVVNGCSRLKDLSPLEGMALEVLAISMSAVADLTPLRDMPLSQLEFHTTKVRDLTPLEGMPLESIALPGPYSSLKGLDILRAMPTLKRFRVGAYSFDAEEFWRKLDAGEFK